MIERTTKEKSNRTSAVLFRHVIIRGPAPGRKYQSKPCASRRGYFRPPSGRRRNSPIVCAKLNAVPVIAPAVESGRITRKKVSRRDTPSVHEASIACDPRSQIRMKTAAPRTAGCKSPTRSASPPKVKGSGGRTRIARVFPGRFSRTEANQDVIPEHRGRQDQRKRDDGFDQEFPAPARKCHPIGDGQAHDQKYPGKPIPPASMKARLPASSILLLAGENNP